MPTPTALPSSLVAALALLSAAPPARAQMQEVPQPYVRRCEKIRSWSGSTDFGEFGTSVSGAGDVDGDGRPDVIVGAHEIHIVGTGGYARVFSGGTGALIHEFQPPILFTAFGGAVAGAGDVDRDGHDDLLVGAPNDVSSDAEPETRPGSARVYSGATGAELARFLGATHQALFGAALAEAGDVNCDGWPDVLVGAPEDDLAAPGAGMVQVLSGEWIARTASGQLPATPRVLLTILGNNAFSSFGHAVDGLGEDVDGDGFPDLVVGEPGDDLGGTEAGRVTVHSGATGAELYSLVGLGDYDLFGYSVAGLGDVDGDGVGDLAAGAPHFLFGAPAYVRVFSGATGALIHHLPQTEPYDYFGFDTSGVGDTNGDGHADLVVGAWGAAGERGRAFVYSGADASLLCIHGPALPGDHLGWSVGGAGDVDGDGSTDFVVGARQLSNGPGYARTVRGE